MIVYSDLQKVDCSLSFKGFGKKNLYLLYTLLVLTYEDSKQTKGFSTIVMQFKFFEGVFFTCESKRWILWWMNDGEIDDEVFKWM